MSREEETGSGGGGSGLETSSQLSPAPISRRLRAGETLGRYRIVELLGAGGMGEVYRARDAELDRFVAIKVVPEEVALDPARLSRFRREAQALAAVSHPNILEIYDFGSEGGVTFAVEELLEGHDLRRKMNHGALDLPTALKIGTAIAEGLAAAHAGGVVHRDIKPENIFVTTDERIKILDFGLAKVVRESNPEDETGDLELALTGVGTVLGTSGYMSPEQVRGNVADTRSDLFSLGCVLHEMVTGERTFRRKTAADTMAAILNEAAPELAPSITAEKPEVAQVIGRCLEKSAEDRFQTAAELAEALRSSVSSSAVSSVTETDSSSILGDRSLLSRWLLSRIGVLSTLLIALSVIGFFFEYNRRTGIRGNGSTESPTRIVILPFQNMGFTEDDFFAAGVSDELTSRLAAVSRLRVVSAGSEEQLNASVSDLGRTLDVDYVLKGTVRWNRTGVGPEMVRITPKLIRVTDGNLMWAGSFDRVLDDIFQVQTEIAGSVLAELDVTILGGEQRSVDARHTDNMEAYQSYLRGMYAGQSAIDEELFLSASLLEQAVNLDPGFALAYAELSMVHSRIITARIDFSEARTDSAKTTARRALALDPNLARAHLALAVFLAGINRDRSGALAELEIARGLSPNDIHVLLQEGQLLTMEGLFQKASEVLTRALEVDPTNYRAQVSLGESLLALRRHSEADSAHQRAIELNPDRLDAYMGRYWNALAWEGGTELGNRVLDTVPEARHRDIVELRLFAVLADREFERALDLLPQMPREGVEYTVWKWPSELIACVAYHWLDRKEEAYESCSSALAISQYGLMAGGNDPRLWAAIGYSQALLGNRAEAIDAAEHACSLADSAWDQIQFRADLAAIAAIAGDADRAIELIREELALPGWVTRAWLKIEYRYDNLRDDPRFQELIREP